MACAIPLERVLVALMTAPLRRCHATAPSFAVFPTPSHAAAPPNPSQHQHRIREIVGETGNPRIFQHLHIPRSMTASWLSRGRWSVTSLDWQHDIGFARAEIVSDQIVTRAQGKQRDSKVPQGT